ncbi:hypothetical protein [Halorarum salinum]|uniref:Uncharacterized protein n=1 Tax=Halorarum salinum TaxID=2743089 RepID=A0A7D5LAJ7_9EURY|nr:hypothetical protein [Halobaculum salinum]QLG61887.1 hypothetical protein HUG12_09210 [Halobaculum salinum]
MERQIDRYVDRFEHLYTIGRGRLDGTRERVKDRLIAFYEELRDEQRDHWRDRQRIEQERRDVRRELAATGDDALADLL